MTMCLCVFWCYIRTGGSEDVVDFWLHPGRYIYIYIYRAIVACIQHDIVYSCMCSSSVVYTQL